MFDVGEQVLLKLQSYAQSTVANRPCRKLTYKNFSPFTTTERVSTLAYRLQLPPDSRIHSIFHDSQLQPFVPDHTPVFLELSRVPDLTSTELITTAILDRRMMKKGDAPFVHLQVHLKTLLPTATTWEDFDVLRQRYPTAWEGNSSHGGANVTPVDRSG